MSLESTMYSKCINQPREGGMALFYLLAPDVQIYLEGLEDLAFFSGNSDQDVNGVQCKFCSVFSKHCFVFCFSNYMFLYGFYIVLCYSYISELLVKMDSYINLLKK